MKKLLPSEELAQIKLNRIEMWRRFRVNAGNWIGTSIGFVFWLSLGGAVLVLIILCCTFLNNADDHKAIKDLQYRVNCQSAFIAGLSHAVQELQAANEVKPQNYLTNVIY